MVVPSEGAKRLREFLQAHGLKQTRLAELLSVSDPTIHDWLKGTKRPRKKFRRAIETWTKGEVSASAWGEPEDADEEPIEIAPFDAGPDDSAPRRTVHVDRTG